MMDQGTQDAISSVPVPTIQMLVDIKSEILVLDFLDQMPEPHRSYRPVSPRQKKYSRCSISICAIDSAMTSKPAVYATWYLRERLLRSSLYSSLHLLFPLSELRIARGD